MAQIPQSSSQTLIGAIKHASDLLMFILFATGTPSLQKRRVLLAARSSVSSTCFGNINWIDADTIEAVEARLTTTISQPVPAQTTQGL